VNAGATGMVCTATSTAKSGRYRLTATYLTDPRRDSVVVHTSLTPLQPGALKLYVRVDATIGGNGGGGTAAGQNSGADSATIDAGTGALVSFDTNTVTAAVNRDYAQPTYLAVRATRPFVEATSGYAGSPSDGLVQLDQSQAPTTGSAATGGRGEAVPALGSPRGRGGRITPGGQSLDTRFDALQSEYVRGWQA